MSNALPATALSTNALSKRFRHVDALHELTLQVPEGSIFALVGTNGAGKTTTIKAVMNILKPTSGHATVLGTDSRRLGPDDFARIGYVSENQEMPDWMTVGYFLDYLKPFYPTWDDARAAELVDQLQLPRERKLRHLSRGMRIKAALASSLSYRPRLLVLDEPFGGLDPLVRDEVIEGLLDSAGETTIFISSHDLAEIESFATHIGYLDRGRLQFSEEMATLSARFREVEVTLDRPAGLPVALPEHWPGHWLRPEAAPTMVRFVDSRFENGRTQNEIRQLFGEVRDVTAYPMALRAIFVALAKSGATLATTGAKS
jgi:ABC-2 type transport system ATP-binding protein